MSKKLHAKDLRRDEVAEAVGHAAESTFQVAQEHRRPLIIGVVALGVIVIAGIVLAWRTDANRREANLALAGAMKAWDEASGTPAEGETKPTWDEVATALAAAAEGRERTAAGKLASLHHGLALARAGKAAEAAAALEGFVSRHPSHWGAPDALAALASAKEDMGDAAAAEQALVRLRDGKSWRSWPPGAAEMLLAQLYERQGRSADARAIYEKLTSDEKLKDTTWGSQARARLDEMGGATPAS